MLKKTTNIKIDNKPEFNG